MKVRNLDGIIVDILARRELQTNRGILCIASWFYDENEETLEKLKSSHVEHETDNAVLLANDDAQLWIPKRVIEKVR